MISQWCISLAALGKEAFYYKAFLTKQSRVFHYTKEDMSKKNAGKR